MLREKGVKTLLQQLRGNVDSSSKQFVEPIRMSKLMSCGEAPKRQASRSESPSKVLINPVPVDIKRKNQATKDSSPASPEKRPTSILKKNSSNIFNGSSISAISNIE